MKATQGKITQDTTTQDTTTQDTATRPEIIIDTEFKDLLPALDAETYATLEENLTENGCRDPLITWNNYLIDGHNRYEICTRLDIPYEVRSMEFPTREDVVIWIIANQISRRNLLPMQLSYYRGRHYHADKLIIKNVKGNNQYKVDKPDNQVKPLQDVKALNNSAADAKTADARAWSTATRLANKYHVSRDTIEHDAKVANAIDKIGEKNPDAKRRILAGDSRYEKKALEALLTATDEELNECVEKISDGTFGKKASHAKTDDGANGATGANGANGTTAGANSANGATGATGNQGFPGLSEANHYAMAKADITRILLSEQKKLTKSIDMPELKATLRTFINTLENLYTKYC